jgi:hypothetical protein
VSRGLDGRLRRGHVLYSLNIAPPFPPDLESARQMLDEFFCSHRLE